MTTKQMKFDAEARAEFKTGIDKLASAVAVTMGPAGHNVVMGCAGGTVQVLRHSCRNQVTAMSAAADNPGDKACSHNLSNAANPRAGLTQRAFSGTVTVVG